MHQKSNYKIGIHFNPTILQRRLWESQKEGWELDYFDFSCVYNYKISFSCWVLKDKQYNWEFLFKFSASRKLLFSNGLERNTKQFLGHHIYFDSMESLYEWCGNDIRRQVFLHKMT